jgi:hypothetical protein
MRRPAIPLSDPGALARRARRTLLVRAGLGAALVGALFAVFVGSHQTKKGGMLLPSGRSPIIALDLSWSVSYDSSLLIERTMKDFAESGRRVGLVLFSDIPYEALPPGTRAAALSPYVRFFSGDGSPNPWTDAFSAGTRISGALDLAHEMLVRDGIKRGTVILISDLADAPNDRAELTRSLVSYTREQIPIQVVAVNPTKEDERLFRGALGPGGGSVTTLRPTPRHDTLPRTHPSFPLTLVIAIGVLALLLAVNEHALGTLSWGRRSTA